MSFICAVTGKASPSEEKPLKLVVKTRNKTYINYVGEDAKDLKTTYGHETVKEINISKAGQEQLLALEASEKAI